jgi:hypothetical protein
MKKILASSLVLAIVALGSATIYQSGQGVPMGIVPDPVFGRDPLVSVKSEAFGGFPMGQYSFGDPIHTTHAVVCDPNYILNSHGGVGGDWTPLLDGTAGWISHSNRAGYGSGGAFRYSFRFTSAPTVNELNLLWRADNFASIFLNGHEITAQEGSSAFDSTSPAHFHGLTAGLLNTGVLANEMVFYVTNGYDQDYSSPSGLQFKMETTPEPASCAVLGAGVLALFKRRR